jgi:hypothetical protein
MDGYWVGRSVFHHLAKAQQVFAGGKTGETGDWRAARGVENGEPWPDNVGIAWAAWSLRSRIALWSLRSWRPGRSWRTCVPCGPGGPCGPTWFQDMGPDSFVVHEPVSRSLSTLVLLSQQAFITLLSCATTNPAVATNRTATIRPTTSAYVDDVRTAALIRFTTFFFLSSVSLSPS